MTSPRILVCGAGGAVGLEIVKSLAARGVRPVATYRTARKTAPGAIEAAGGDPVQWDLNDRETGARLLADVEGAAFTPILTVARLAAGLAPATARSVFFSSNNVAIDPSAPVYARLLEAETHVRQSAPNAMILRPTMIYGFPGDGNLSRLMKMMRRTPITPMMGAGEALQQPVFFRDFGGIVADLLLGDEWRPGVRPVAGPAPTTLKEVYRAAARAANAKTLTASFPSAPLAQLCAAAEKIGLSAPLSSAQLARANADKTPRGDRPLLAGTSLEDGLKALAGALDEARSGP